MLGLDRNHSEICKFLGKDDYAYQGVQPNLRAMAEASRSHNVQCDHKVVTCRSRTSEDTEFQDMLFGWSLY